MHPDVIRDLVNQRAEEARARASAARLVKAARKLRHAQRDLEAASDVLGTTAIPDYVHAMFGQPGHGNPGQGHEGRGHVGHGRHAGRPFVPGQRAA